MIITIKEGFLYLREHREVALIITVSAFVNFFLAGYNLFIPYTNIIMIGIVKDMYGKLLIAEAIGGILGSFINIRCKKDITISYLLYLLGVSGTCLAFFSITLSYFKLVFILLLPIVLFNIFLTMFNIRLISFIQQTVEIEYAGRVFSIVFTVALLFMPLGSILFSTIINQFAIENYLIIGSSITLLAIIFEMIKKYAL